MRHMCGDVVVSVATGTPHYIGTHTPVAKTQFLSFLLLSPVAKTPF